MNKTIELRGGITAATANRVFDLLIEGKIGVVPDGMTRKQMDMVIAAAQADSLIFCGDRDERQWVGRLVDVVGMWAVLEQVIVLDDCHDREVALKMLRKASIKYTERGEHAA